MTDLRIPLFPLGTVLFPDGPLPLRIFEPRYLEMVSTCLKSDGPFGVCLIKEGKEVGEVAEPHSVGTLATIVDWNQLPDGLLGITTQGGQRFRIDSKEIGKNQLITAEVALIPDDPTIEVPDKYAELVELLRRVLSQPDTLYEGMDHQFHDATWVGYRLAELLPLEPGEKQGLLESKDPTQRLAHLHEAIMRLAAEAKNAQ